MHGCIRARAAFALVGAVAFAAPVALAGGSTPPSVTVTFPNGGQTFTSSTPINITWIATDNAEIAAVDVEASFDDGVTWRPILKNSYNYGTFTWFVQNRPTTTAKIRVLAYDFEYNIGSDVSDAPFTIVSAGGARVPTTLRDFDMPGTQPLGIPELPEPDVCATCHGNYDNAVEPFFNWQGSMMAYSAVDPIFRAGLHIANVDAKDSGDLCLRCHVFSGWVQGRSTPTDGSQLTQGDLNMGVGCAVCHTMVDPIYQAGVSPPEDADILADINAPTTFGNAQIVSDPADFRFRGPFVDAVAGHDFLPSPFHKESALCGTCHDVSLVTLDRLPDGSQPLNALDTPAAALGAHQVGVEQRTYSEWFYSAFNTPGGVFAPEFGGNRTHVSSCQDCHMRAVTGRGCFFEIAPIRTDLPLHDLTGGSTWMLSIMPQVIPESTYLNLPALQSGINRARYMLQNAATMELRRAAGNAFAVKITNKTGHKLLTGYAEGRRMWISVRFFDVNDTLISASGAYNFATGELASDPQRKVYEAKLTTGAEVAAASGLPEGTEFHLVLQSQVARDNRIPPLGWQPAAYQTFGSAPVGATYAAGQNWDETLYTIPPGAVKADVVLYYQSTTKEYIEFLRDNGGTAGAFIYNLWNTNGKAPPERMVEGTIYLLRGDMNCDGLVNNFDIDPWVIALLDEAAYAQAYPQCNRSLGDIDGDGLFNNFDIDPFVNLILGMP